jgi:hypothetical protein
MERTVAEEQGLDRQLRHWLAFALVTAREPAVRRHPAVLLQRLVLLMPPETIRFDSSIIRVRARFVLGAEVEWTKWAASRPCAC